MRLALRWCACLALAPIAAGAQGLQPEIRVDAIGPRPYSLQAGAGIVMPLGNYVRTSADIGWGRRDAAALSHGEWRGDLLTRFLFDPFRQERWGLSVGGGLSVRRHAYLAAVLDLEGPSIKGLVPALQVGLGGGPRAGLILRRELKGRR